MDLQGKHFVLGLSGGIACYKAAELCRALIKEGATVQVVMTAAAEQFITPVTMQALSGRPVYGSHDVSGFDAREANGMPHINLSREADAVLIAPCSADFMAKLLHGRADDLLSLMCLARPIGQVPLLLAPAMNREMWAHPATQRNMVQLAADGATILGVGSGFQACGETGDGRMLEPPELLHDIVAFFQPKLLAGQRVVVTAGPTFEAMDPIRGITNHSSGKMGFAIARAAREAGAEVTLVAGPVSQPTPRGVTRVDVTSARQMLEATQRNLAQVAQDGATVLAVGNGDQACGETGDGRMLEPEELLEEVIAFFTPKVLAGQKVLVTAGPTFEAIDPVRGITNHSSGKMGFAIARAAREAGAEVTLVAGPVHLATPRGVHRINVQSAQNMLEAVMQKAQRASVFIATAAVADWRPATQSEQKIKKDGSGQTPVLGFVENPDILATVAQSQHALVGDLFCVGFAAESHDLLAHATAKRQRKGVPLLVGNIGPATFGQDDNALLLVDAQGHHELPRASKRILAQQLIAEIAQRLPALQA